MKNLIKYSLILACTAVAVGCGSDIKTVSPNPKVKADPKVQADLEVQADPKVQGDKDKKTNLIQTKTETANEEGLSELVDIVLGQPDRSETSLRADNLNGDASAPSNGASTPSLLEDILDPYGAMIDSFIENPIQ